MIQIFIICIDWYFLQSVIIFCKTSFKDVIIRFLQQNVSIYFYQYVNESLYHKLTIPPEIIKNLRSYNNFLKIPHQYMFLIL